MTSIYDERAPRGNYTQKGIYKIVPPTTDSALVFPYDKSNKRFDRNFYSSALTDGRTSSEQMDSFLKEVEKKFHKKISKVNKLNKFFACTAILGFAILVLYGMCIINDSDMYMDDGDDFESYDDGDTFFTAMMGYFFAVIFYSVILQVYSNRKHKKARKSVQGVIDKYSPAFAAQGLRWNIPLPFPEWIELWKDYKGQSSYSQSIAPSQGTYALPPAQSPITYQYPMPQQNMPRNPLSPQIRTLYPSLMAQPLLAQQNQNHTQENTNYLPPNQINYSNYEN